MKDIIEFCLEFELIKQGDADYILYEYERSSEDPIRAILKHINNEQALFLSASEKYTMPLIPLNNITLPLNFSEVLDEGKQNYFNCKVISAEENKIQVATWNFFTLDYLAQALENLAGKAVEVSLITCSDFDKLNTQ